MFESAQNNQAMDYVDKLIYEYSPKSNQLIDVVDNADDSSTNTFNGGFKDKYAGNNYIYGDANGNMTKDNNKDINSISYNHLNLPTSVTFADDRSIRYTYDATGVKLKKEIFLSLPDLFNPVANTTTYYAGNYIYEKDGSGESLKFFSHPEGYIEKNGAVFDYVYQYKDHLGNIRLSYKNISTTGVNLQIVEENNYYPFGLEHKGYGAPRISNHPYKFGGKEFNEELGLDWYDVSARNYDPALGRWMNIDPLAEKMRRHSPYNYAFNNPLRFTDPDGMAPQDIIFILDKEAARNNGHIAVLIGSEKTGWTYISMNGTGEGAKPWGISENADVKTAVVDNDGRVITDAQEAFNKANNINPEEEHSYDLSERITTTEDEDENAITDASAAASVNYYAIAGPGNSCIDVAQAAFASVVKSRGLGDSGNIPGKGDLIPNNWFKKLENRIDNANARAKDDSQKIIKEPKEEKEEKE